MVQYLLLRVCLLYTSFSKNRNSETSNVYEFGPREKVDYEILSSIKFNALKNTDWQSDSELKIILNNTSRSLMAKLNQFNLKIDDVTKSVRGILADKDDYSEKQKTGQEPVFVGKLDRYYIEENKFQFINYGENLKEKPSSFDYFTGERILIRRIVNRQFRIMASLTKDKFVTKKDIYTFKVTNNNYPSHLLLAIINSKLISYIKTKGSASAKKDDFTQLTLNDIRQIHIPTVGKDDLERIKIMVNELLSLKKIDNENTEKIESELDAVVYNLYQLSKDEIKIIEAN